MEETKRVSKGFIGLCLISIFFSSSVSWAGDDVKNIAFNNISQEYVNCASYFSIVAQGLRNSRDEKTAKAYDESSKAALEVALEAAKLIKSPEMAMKVTAARYELSMKEMLLEIGGDTSNISILLNKYAYRCKDALDNPKVIISEWLERAEKKAQ